MKDRGGGSGPKKAPSNIIKRIVIQFPLDITVTPLTHKKYRGLTELEHENAAKVVTVTKDSLAWNNKIGPGDIIRKIENHMSYRGRTLTKFDEIEDAITRPSGFVTLFYERVDNIPDEVRLGEAVSQYNYTSSNPEAVQNPAAKLAKLAKLAYKLMVNSAIPPWRQHVIDNQELTGARLYSTKDDKDITIQDIVSVEESGKLARCISGSKSDKNGNIIQCPDYLHNGTVRGTDECVKDFFQSSNPFIRNSCILTKGQFGGNESLKDIYNPRINGFKFDAGKMTDGCRIETDSELTSDPKGYRFAKDSSRAGYYDRSDDQSPMRPFYQNEQVCNRLGPDGIRGNVPLISKNELKKRMASKYARDRASHCGKHINQGCDLEPCQRVVITAGGGVPIIKTFDRGACKDLICDNPEGDTVMGGEAKGYGYCDSEAFNNCP